MNRHAANDIDRISLSHGQARWVLHHVFDLGEYSDAAFDSYLKFLRRNGVPFAQGETPGGPGINVAYRYEHVMELAVALALRRQAVLKKDAVTLLVQLRNALRPLYRRAWLERDRGLGKQVTVEITDANMFRVSGVWLYLGLRYSEGQVLTSTGPKLLGPAEAIGEFCRVNLQRYFRDPIRISDIAAAVVDLAAAAPEIRRGRR